MPEHNSTKRLKHMCLFSGIGGFALGLGRTGGFETICFAEIDPFCQKVLNKHWPDVPIHNDVRNLEYDGAVDIITGGYPCQPFSFAGKRKGEEDDRHLWPAMFSLVKKHRPAWVIGENVAGHINMGLDAVLIDLESEGYGCRVFVIPACAINAPHRRDRVWIIANSESKQNFRKKRERIQPDFNGKAITDPSSSRLQGVSEKKISRKRERKIQSTRTLERIGKLWDLPSSRVCRGDDGVRDRAHRLKSLGNAVVPQIPEIIGHAILEAENSNLSEE